MTFWDWVAGNSCCAGSFLLLICGTVAYCVTARAQVRNNETKGRMFESALKKDGTDV